MEAGNGGELGGGVGGEAEGGNTEPLKFFSFYLDLPEVVRLQVLSYLTSPQDKLNLIKAVPSESKLMRWNRTNLEFELIFPILMKARVLDLESVKNLSAVNGDIGRVIKTYFEPDGMDTFFFRRSDVRYLVRRCVHNIIRAARLAGRF